MMDINALRIIATVISFIVFVGILAWAWKNRHTSDFKDAANLPFKEDQKEQEDKEKQNE
jgi:cytochrome c oxidase cbb3-type subunit 4